MTPAYHTSPAAPALPPVPATALIRELIVDDRADEHCATLITLVSEHNQGVLQ